MTSKEKAKNIYNNYKDCFDYDFMDKPLNDYMATKYSLLCVNEIIKATQKENINNNGTGIDVIPMKYWLDVKDEISLL